METPNSSPNKRLKTETLTLESPISPTSAKGKAPISDELAGDDDGYESPADLPPQNCGICFSEEGKSVRGLIDSCDHHFCFLCIIEWSKIESRCPLCRARFSTIRRLRKDGSVIGDGFVRVPVRDQIYDPFGEPTDPYAQARCIVCSGTTDESLLLLCDLCDLPWHTYCVGLGATVPEGDWYCRDCALLQAEQCGDEWNDNVDSHSSVVPDHVDEASTTASVSIFDIVREPSEPLEPDSGVDRLLKLVSPPKKKFSGSTIASDQENVTIAGNLQGRRGILKSRVDVTESSARTLRNCRNVHKHISVLRENWDAFRGGSLRFSSDSLDSRGKGRRKINVVATLAERSRSLSSTSSLQSKAQDTSCDAKPNKQPYNEDRAWKLMNKAKSMQQVGKRKSTLKTSCSKVQVKGDNVASKCVPLGRKDLLPLGSGMPNRTDDVMGRLAQRSGQQQFTRIFTEAANASSSKYQNCTVSRLSSSRKRQTLAQADIYHDRASIPSWGKLGRGLPTNFDDGATCSTSSCGSIAKSFDVSCTKVSMKELFTCPGEQVGNTNSCIAGQAEVPTSAQADMCHDRAGCLPSQENVGGRLSNVLDDQKITACTTSPSRPLAGAPNASCVKLQGEDISGCPSKVKIASKTCKSDEAKGEIQSLVKLNLKLLTKDKRLGADAFKEIARLSTHTILAACGFEHRKIVHSHPTAVCHHGDQIQQLHRSTLMPSSCRECFYLFVKNVVNSIMSEKLNSDGVAC